MFDTINLKLTADEVTGCNLLEIVPPCLDDVAEHTKNGDVWLSGYLGNLAVYLNKWECKVGKGSLCKWWLGNNIEVMNRKDTKQAVEALSDTLHLPMERARVTRLDIGGNLIVKHSTSTYFDRLGQLRYYTRLSEPTGLYYSQKCTKLCFYDKVAEQRSHKAQIPELYYGKNLLRYEQRYESRIAARLKVNEVRAESLYDEQFYANLVQRWRDTYFAIKKIHNTQTNFAMIKGKKQLYKAAVLLWITTLGGKIEALRQIEVAQMNKELNYSQAQDLRQAIAAATEVDGLLVTESDVITELDEKIREAARVYTR